MPKPSTVSLLASAVAPASAAGVSSPSPSPPSRTRPLKNRTFSAAYKLQIVEELQGAPPSKIAEVLRREGLYSSHLSKWRRALSIAGPSGLQPKKTGRPRKPEESKQLEQLLHRNEQLERELAIARKLLEVQKKVSEILGLTLSESAMP